MQGFLKLQQYDSILEILGCMTNGLNIKLSYKPVPYLNQNPLFIGYCFYNYDIIIAPLYSALLYSMVSETHCTSGVVHRKLILCNSGDWNTKQSNYERFEL